LSHYDYERSLALRREPFYGLLMAAMRGADSNNADKLRAAWPRVWDELQDRYDAPGGLLESDSQ